MSNPTEKPTDHPRTATAFEKELWVFQNDAPKTPTSAMSNAGCVVGMGVFVWVVFFGLRLVGLSVEDFFKDSGPLLGIAGILLMILAILSPIIGAGLFLVALVRPRRSVKCPYCLADHSLFRAVSSYVCTGCASVLRFVPAKTSADMVKVSCPACNTEWATTPDAGRTNCFSCGLPLEVVEGQSRVAGVGLACWSCSARISEGVFCCNHCGCLVTEPRELPEYRSHTDLHEMVLKALPPTTPDGMDAISLRANSAIGFLVRALWKAQTVLTRNLASADSGKSFLLTEQTTHLRALDEAMDFLNEAITIKPELAPAVQASLPVYDACVALILARMDEQSQSQDFSLKAAYKEILKTLPEKRNALVNRLCEEPASSQKWPEPLVKLEESGNAISVSNADSVRAWASKLTTPSQIGKVRVPGEAMMSIRKL